MGLSWNKNFIHEEVESILNSRNSCYHLGLVQNLSSSRLLSKNLKICETSGQCTGITRFSKGLWQWLIHYRNILLDIHRLSELPKRRLYQIYLRQCTMPNVVFLQYQGFLFIFLMYLFLIVTTYQLFVSGSRGFPLYK
jgi:hypothetical protein